MKGINLKRKLSVAMAIAVAASSMTIPVSAAETNEDNQVVEVTEADDQRESRDNAVVYGTIDMPYAEFYYGELEGLDDYVTYLADNTLPSGYTGELVDVVGSTTIDVGGTAKGYRDEGMYDAFTSASQSVTYGTTFYENLDDGGRLVLGNADVQVAVNKDLYDSAVAAIATEPDLVNQYKFYEYIKNLELADEGVTYSDYKVLTSEGVFSKMYTEDYAKYTDADVEIDTTGTWGQYEIMITLPEGVSIDSDSVMGIIVETSDGSQYGMKHTDNIWRQARLIGFSCIEGCVEVKHKMPLQWQRFADMPGKTISKITYLMKDSADLIFDTSVVIQKILDDDQGYTPQDASYNSNGTQVQMTKTVPDDADYKLASVEATSGTLDVSLYEYDYTNNVLTLGEQCHPGAYTATFQDATGIYADVVVDLTINSNMTADAVTAPNNQLQVVDDVTTLAEYISEITAVTVNGTTTTAAVGSLIFGTDGVINFDAVYSLRGSSTVIFPQGADGDYELVIEASGFATVTLNVGTSYVVKEPVDQTISVNSSYTKTYGDAAFSLNAKAQSALSYSSSNTSVATVDANGKVTIKGAGSAVITVKAAATSSYNAATAKVTIKVNKAAASITAKSYTKTYGNKAFSLSAKATGGALSYKSSSSKIVSVSSAGKATIKGTGKATITITSAENANYKKAEKKITVTVKPKKQTVKKFTSTKKKKATVTWKKDTNASGYEITVALNKKFTKKAKTITISKAKTTKKTISKLTSGKTWYVKVRAYKKSGGTKIYGAYSTPKKVKVK